MEPASSAGQPECLGGLTLVGRSLGCKVVGIEPKGKLKVAMIFPGFNRAAKPSLTN